jgi:PTH2 family peptidyl-tRNA hydrolase
MTTGFKQVIVIRKDLNMRKGKMVAQGAHASLAAILNLAQREGHRLVIPLDARIEPWLTGRFTKICVSVNSERELLDIHAKATANGLVTSLILDAGLTEFGGVPTHTAVAVGPDTAANVDLITANLPLL